ncbi:MAG TPA: ATP-binding cassette domain-containing protein [Actinomycetes bacterium]|nr:ATP-binding cassette domain-containing protein [Actinomycetes bacterium]
MSALTADGLTRRFGDLVAVNNLTFEVPDGVVVGFVGPNGSGKSTTIRVLLGLIEASGGTGTVLGEPIEHPKGNVYFGIGNMYQYSVAVSHPSKRLYVDSAVALDASSGKLRRDFQPVPDDFYDWSPCAAARAGCRVVAKYVATNTDE